MKKWGGGNIFFFKVQERFLKEKKTKKNTKNTEKHQNI